MNFTFDDSETDLLYSSNWETQLPRDPNLSSFFQSTYHAATSDGATVNFTFFGSAIFIVGSKGPDHGKFTVQCDDLIAPNIDAGAPTTSFQQLLFDYTFPENGQHFVSVTAQLSERNDWLDVDYLTFTQLSNTSDPVTTAPASATTDASTGTVVPPWVTTSVSISASLIPSVSAASAATSTSNPTLIAASVLGSVLGLLLLGALAFILIRHLRNHSTDRERSFRRGSSPLPGVVNGGDGGGGPHTKLYSTPNTPLHGPTSEDAHSLYTRPRAAPLSPSQYQYQYPGPIQSTSTLDHSQSQTSHTKRTHWFPPVSFFRSDTNNTNNDNVRSRTSSNASRNRQAAGPPYPETRQRAGSEISNPGIPSPGIGVGAGQRLFSHAVPPRRGIFDTFGLRNGGGNGQDDRDDADSRMTDFLQV